MFDIKKIVLFVSIVIALALLTLIARGTLSEEFELSAIIGTILAIYIYTIVRDSQIETKLSAMEESIGGQADTLKKAVTILPNGSFPIDLIQNPKDPERWMHFQEEIKIFNAPWTLASGPLYPGFKNFLSQDNVKLKILIFDHNRKEPSDDYTNKLNRVAEFIKILNDDRIDLKGKIIVKRACDASMPTTTFFLSKKGGYPSSILYIYPFVDEEPILSVELNDEQAFGAMSHHFSSYWTNADEIEIS